MLCFTDLPYLQYLKLGKGVGGKVEKNIGYKFNIFQTTASPYLFNDSLELWRIVTTAIWIFGNLFAFTTGITGSIIHFPSILWSQQAIHRFMSYQNCPFSFYSLQLAHLLWTKTFGCVKELISRQAISVTWIVITCPWLLETAGTITMNTQFAGKKSEA